MVYHPGNIFINCLLVSETLATKTIRNPKPPVKRPLSEIGNSNTQVTKFKGQDSIKSLKSESGASLLSKLCPNDVTIKATTATASSESKSNNDKNNDSDYDLKINAGQIFVGYKHDIDDQNLIPIDGFFEDNIYQGIGLKKISKLLMRENLLNEQSSLRGPRGSQYYIPLVKDYKMIDYESVRIEKAASPRTSEIEYAVVPLEELKKSSDFSPPATETNSTKSPSSLYQTLRVKKNFIHEVLINRHLRWATDNATELDQQLDSLWYQIEYIIDKMMEKGNEEFSTKGYTGSIFEELVVLSKKPDTSILEKAIYLFNKFFDWLLFLNDSNQFMSVQRLRSDLKPFASSEVISGFWHNPLQMDSINNVDGGIISALNNINYDQILDENSEISRFLLKMGNDTQSQSQTQSQKAETGSVMLPMSSMNQQEFLRIGYVIVKLFSKEPTIVDAYVERSRLRYIDDKLYKHHKKSLKLRQAQSLLTSTVPVAATTEGVKFAKTESTKSSTKENLPVKDNHTHTDSNGTSTDNVSFTVYNRNTKDTFQVNIPTKPQDSSKTNTNTSTTSEPLCLPPTTTSELSKFIMQQMLQYKKSLDFLPLPHVRKTEDNKKHIEKNMLERFSGIHSEYLIVCENQRIEIDEIPLTRVRLENPKGNTIPSVSDFDVRITKKNIDLFYNQINEITKAITSSEAGDINTKSVQNYIDVIGLNDFFKSIPRGRNSDYTLKEHINFDPSLLAFYRTIQSVEQQKWQKSPYLLELSVYILMNTAEWLQNLSVKLQMWNKKNKVKRHGRDDINADNFGKILERTMGISNTISGHISLTKSDLDDNINVIHALQQITTTTSVIQDIKYPEGRPLPEFIVESSSIFSKTSSDVKFIQTGLLIVSVLLNVFASISDKHDLNKLDINNVILNYKSRMMDGRAMMPLDPNQWVRSDLENLAQGYQWEREQEVNNLSRSSSWNDEFDAASDIQGNANGLNLAPATEEGQTQLDQDVAQLRMFWPGDDGSQNDSEYEVFDEFTSEDGPDGRTDVDEEGHELGYTVHNASTNSDIYRSISEDSGEYVNGYDHNMNEASGEYSIGSHHHNADNENSGFDNMSDVSHIQSESEFRFRGSPSDESSSSSSLDIQLGTAFRDGTRLIETASDYDLEWDGTVQDPPIGPIHSMFPNQGQFDRRGNLARRQRYHDSRQP